MAYGRVTCEVALAATNGFMVKQPIDRAQQVPSVPCQMKTISVRRQDEVAGGLSLAKTLYHVGWYTGLSTTWCHRYNPDDPADADKLPPIDKKNCVENNALQGTMMNNVNLPMKDATKHFFSCIIPARRTLGLVRQVETPGELINVLNSIETIVGNPFTPDDVLNFSRST